MKAFCKIFIPVYALIFLLQSCGEGADQKTISMKADSLLIRVQCVKTVSELIEKTMLIPSIKKLEYKMEYINETYPDTITRPQAEKIIRLKNACRDYESLLKTTRSLQQQSQIQLLQVNKLNGEIKSGKDENMLQYLTFEGKCADTLNIVLDAVIKKSIDLGCYSKNLD
ncbi:MAG: hypothetical protein ACXVPN_06795 [Bacteroidia bacterium]